MTESRALPSMLLLVIALLLAAILFRGGDAPPRQSRSAPLSTGRLEQVTARLALAVEKLEIALARQSSSAPAQIQEQERPVVLLPTPDARVEAIPRAHEIKPKNEKRVRELRPMDRGTKEILREYAFRTYADILDEFGFPDEIWLGTDALRFNYEFERPEGYTGNLTFAFVHGVVMGVYN